MQGKEQRSAKNPGEHEWKLLLQAVEISAFWKLLQKS